MYSDSICCTVLRKIEEAAREGNIKENVNTQSIAQVSLGSNRILKVQGSSFMI